MWLGYGTALAREAGRSLNALPLGAYRPSFDAEVAARQSMVKIWRELNEKEPQRFAYMESLAAVEQAGFLREYVWHYHRLAEWPPVADLRNEAFAGWRAEQLRDHRPQIGAGVLIRPKTAKK